MPYIAYKLVAYSDSGLRGTYEYFWTMNSKICSPYFKSEAEANQWANKKGILNEPS